jgi:hypothetical protein
MIARVADRRSQDLRAEAAREHLVMQAELGHRSANVRPPLGARPRAAISRIVCSVAALFGLRLMPFLSGVCAGTTALLLGSEDPEAGVVIHGSR